MDICILQACNPGSGYLLFKYVPVVISHRHFAFSFCRCKDLNLYEITRVMIILVIEECMYWMYMIMNIEYLCCGSVKCLLSMHCELRSDVFRPSARVVLRMEASGIPKQVNGSNSPGR